MRRQTLDDDFVEYVCDQLGELDGVSYRSMFGGYGLYCGATFFGIVYRGKAYFKTSEESRRQYVDWGSEVFQPNAKQSLKAYYEVPGEWIDEASRIFALAEEAVDVARTIKGS